MENKRKKITTTVIAGVTATALLIGGTFAWQSISQTALNEKEAVINPGGRLHDDFDGENKDVYVENFADDDIFARVRLNEYFEIVMNRGITDAEKTEVITAGATKGDTSTYSVHKFGEDNATDDYWQWYTGGQGVYMPTFNKNKDSLVADINGTFAENYEDYEEYEVDDTKESTEIYDSDSNSVDEVRTDLDNLSPYVEAGNIKTVTATHTAKETEDGTLISMEEWLELADNGEDTDNYWVYDTDGWIYWSSPIKAGTATGLLLDKIELKNVMDDSYYYAIEVTGQFITADDLGKDDNTGFYADTTDENPLYTAPSDNALKLLKAIGVDTGDNDSADDEEVFDYDQTLKFAESYDGNFIIVSKTDTKWIKVTDGDEAVAAIECGAMEKWDGLTELTADVDYTYKNGYFKLKNINSFQKGTTVLIVNADNSSSGGFIIIDPYTDELPVPLNKAGNDAGFGAVKIGESIKITFEEYEYAPNDGKIRIIPLGDNQTISDDDYTYENGNLTITNNELAGKVVSIMDTNSLANVQYYPEAYLYIQPAE